MTTVSDTFSICPVCLKRTKAAYIRKDNAIYLEKVCGEHGVYSCLISRNADDFIKWKADTICIKPKESLRQEANGCPHDCGPCVNHLQTACCVLIDVTSRCNQNCPLCFASAATEDKYEPTLRDIEVKYNELLRMSESRKFNIQLSGGEPTVRDDLPEIIDMAKTKGFEYVQLNTNGKRIGMEEGYAHSLKQAGVDAVFMQFDSMTDDIYETLRKERLLEIKKKAVENCRKARLPAALVPTIVRGVNDREIGGIIKYALENIDVVKGIHFQPVSFFGRYPSNFDESNRFTMFDTINEIQKQTDGLIKKEDLLPISTGHNLCCFYATYSRQEDGSYLCTSSNKLNSGDCCTENFSVADSCCSEDNTTADACCDEEPCCPENNLPDDQCCPPDIEIISKDRDYVLSKWKMAGEQSNDGFDEFLNRVRENSFTLTGMAFQDAMSLDTERVSRCRVQSLANDGGLIPFCMYNLTDSDGKYMYRD